ncbi:MULTISPECIES: low molecular weight protein-tyrosine-phosphatase [unclassified Bilifractor]|uniref:low molecular weight protein-tyrosine-phosphatase n=1 Tax=unclassified Bilifractor TaxID=2815795 RepID=UPI003F92A396
MIRILFVCHGNICRSVAAQYIFQNIINIRKIEDRFLVDSAATSTEEIGSPVYPPMEHALRQSGVPIGNHRARRLQKSDYSKYDLIIGMDEENAYYMRRILGDDPENKVHYLMEYAGQPDKRIDDPWYTRKFDLCVSEITEGCIGLLEHLAGPTPGQAPS